MIRTVFMGSPEWAVASLRALAGPEAQRLGVRIVGVLTQPDRPAGRGRHLHPCAVKQAALALGLPALSPASLKSAAGLADLEALAPELAIVCAYGQLLSRRALHLPRFGCWNLHFSLLPRWRGASPVQAAILAGDAATGVALQRMVEALDAGPLAASSAPVPIGPEETAADLGARLADHAAELLLAALPGLLGGHPPVTPQDEGRVTVCRKIDKSAGRVDWATESAPQILRKARAFAPWPGCFSHLGALRLGLVRMEAAPGAAGAPGTVLADGRVVAAAEGAAGPTAVRLLEVRPEGRGTMSFQAFVNGHPGAIGAHLTPEPGSREPADAKASIHPARNVV